MRERPDGGYSYQRTGRSSPGGAEQTDQDWPLSRHAPTVNLYLCDIREDMCRRVRGQVNEYDDRGIVVSWHLPPRHFRLSRRQGRAASTGRRHPAPPGLAGWAKSPGCLRGVSDIAHAPGWLRTLKIECEGTGTEVGGDLPEVVAG
jgi:hypothetical protein